MLRCLGFAATHSEVIFAADLESGTFVKMDRSGHQLYAWVFHAWVCGKRLAGMMILCDFILFPLQVYFYCYYMERIHKVLAK